MRCSCIQEVEKTASQMDWKGKKVLGAELQSIFQLTPKSGRFTCSTITLTLEGVKKKHDIETKHSYCPFCGVKIDDDAADQGRENKTLNEERA